MIVVVGAGPAGLVCAKALLDAGVEFAVLEAGNSPGGRVWTLRTTGGFVLDAGFEVLLESCPHTARHLDLPALEPRFFDPGALICDDGQFFRIMNPLAVPGWCLPSAFTPFVPASDRIRFAALAARCIARTDAALLARCAEPTDESAAAMLVRLGFSERFLRRIARPLFGGALLDSALETSAGLFCYYVKKLATGRVFVPAHGIDAVVKQLAARIPADRFRWQSRVVQLRIQAGVVRGVVTASGAVVPADHVVLAMNEPSARRLLDIGSRRPWRSACVVYLTCERSLYTGALMVLPAGEERLVRRFVQLTNVAPETSPPGFHLISATVLDPGSLSDAALGTAVIGEIEAIFPEAKGYLRHLAVIRVPHALAFHPPGFAASLPPRPAIRGLSLAGDQTTFSNLGAVLESGERAARAVFDARRG